MDSLVRSGAANPKLTKSAGMENQLAELIVCSGLENIKSFLDSRSRKCADDRNSDEKRVSTGQLQLRVTVSAASCCWPQLFAVRMLRMAPNGALKCVRWWVAGCLPSGICRLPDHWTIAARGLLDGCRSTVGRWSRCVCHTLGLLTRQNYSGTRHCVNGSNTIQTSMRLVCKQPSTESSAREHVCQ